MTSKMPSSFINVVDLLLHTFLQAFLHVLITFLHSYSTYVLHDVYCVYLNSSVILILTNFKGNIVLDNSKFKDNNTFNCIMFLQIGTLSTVIESEGCMMVLWKHECTRVFSDRFTVEEDKTWFNDELLSVVEEHLGHELRVKTEPSPVFVDFMRLNQNFSLFSFNYEFQFLEMLQNQLGRKAKMLIWNSRKCTNQ